MLSDRLDRSSTTRIEEMPKSRRWKIRDRVGDRVRWYQEPEEVGDEWSSRRIHRITPGAGPPTVSDQRGVLTI